MKREMKQKWLDALRSGKYEQGTRKLKMNRGGVLQHCCLGVLCELNPDLGSWRTNAFDTVFDFKPVGETYWAADSVLPEPVEAALRFDSHASIPTDLVREVYAARGEEIPDGVAEYLRDRDGDVHENEYVKRGFASLPPLNDAGASFGVIADIIERFVPVED